ncbi:hypothetical protein SOPP22_00910 [Shewanella sp. OPT22]|nr:hypothetical protein SOPP22_00910 [Shewanella sp. OPT22]
MNILIVLILASLSLTACKKEQILNCKNVDLNAPYNVNHIDYLKLRCANNELPDFPKNEKVTAPSVYNPWSDKACPSSLSTLSDKEVFDCANASAVEAIDDGRVEKRAHAVEVLNHAIEKTKNSLDNVSKAALYMDRSLLRVAMGGENNKKFYFIANLWYIQKDLNSAKKLDPNNLSVPYWDYANRIINDSLLNQWKKAVQVGNDGIDNLYYVEKEYGKDQLMESLIGEIAIFPGFPLATGIPQRMLSILDKNSCSDNVPGCNHNDSAAPFSVEGINYTFAEAYARIGNKEKTIEYLNKSLNASNFSEWPYRNLVLDALNSPDELLEQFAKYGPYKQVTFDMKSNQNRSCLLCHGLQRDVHESN